MEEEYSVDGPCSINCTCKLSVDEMIVRLWFMYIGRQSCIPTTSSAVNTIRSTIQIDWLKPYSHSLAPIKGVTTMSCHWTGRLSQSNLPIPLQNSVLNDNVNHTPHYMSTVNLLLIGTNYLPAHPTVCPLRH